MNCFVYRSPKKEELYLFVSEKDKFDKVPAPVMQAFGPPAFVLELALTPQRKLARSDVNEVMRALKAQGFYLQMPLPPELALAKS